MEGFPWNDFRTIFNERSGKATVPKSIETLPKISIAWVWCTYRQTTDGRAMIANRSRSLKTSYHPNLFVCLKHRWGEPEHSRRLGQAGTWLSETTFGEDTALNGRRIKTCVDIFTSVVYTRHEFLSVVRHTQTILSEQLDDVDDSDDDDSSETYDVEEVMAVATIMRLHLRPNVRNTWPSILCAADESRALIKKKEISK